MYNWEFPYGPSASFPQFPLLLISALVWYICNNWWTNTNTLLLLLSKVHGLHKGSLFVLYSSMGFYKCIMSCIHCYSIIWNSFTTLKILYRWINVLPSYPFLPPSQVTTDILLSIILPVPECHKLVIIQHVGLDYCLSLSNMLLSFLHVLLWIHSSFLLIAD